MRLDELVRYLDTYLRVAELPDAPGAMNGLQVENDGEVKRVAAAVDASEAAIVAAAERGCDLLLVHHGLFWAGAQPITGRRYRKLRRLLDEEIAVYGAHIPLDVHPEVGNNAVLARELRVEVRGEFGEYRGIRIGVWGELTETREGLRERLEGLLGGPVRVAPGGPERIRRVGIVSGAAAGAIAEAAAAGLDAFITGEGAHHTYFDAMEERVNVYYGGHYATETWGVRALAAHLEERFRLPWEFLDLPTGM
ncbi:MAG: Nif3-like dinuclear metal center hexameric protein [Gemmatimonadetes bacterium]|nr:Nif3-like dinuclear metal center hexameric protein [Gemmatimonadota bacterium]